MLKTCGSEQIEFYRWQFTVGHKKSRGSERVNLYFLLFRLCSLL